ncbi:ABC transporter substrate-binding protein [Rhodovulum sulfidophilum]|uniref:ABC transporter substrate-binding protein n=1 Tax=Rhodovulum sulfidophilum TaxID=35806 RepID=UPI001922A9A6|nr:ABC transporter substrate-binding protein [Rhodovulum sulfidophilum]MBL3597003.1 ABC transporter substrate-binding protein [Rhodovulum sulfidophilum]
MQGRYLSRRNMVRGGLAIAALCLGSAPRAARSDRQRGSSVSITDIDGRTVAITRPIRRLLLGNGPLAYVMAVLQPENPFANVVGWGNNFRAADLDGYNAYLRRFPDIDRIPSFSSGTLESIGAELAISLEPDVVVMNLSSKHAALASGLMARLAQVGIPVLFVDFRTRMFENTTRSIQILGELLERQDRAARFLQFRQEQIDRVIEPLAKVRSRPRVMVERAAGMYDDCCLTYGDGNFGELIRAAGGDNLGAHFLHGSFGTLHPEQVIESDPDVVLVTGANWSLYSPAGDWVNLGPGADPVEGQSRLHRLMQRPAYRSLRAVTAGRVHAIWHPFYDNPYYFIALQRVAKWLHPEVFAELDPEDTFRELHARFLPVPYESGYWLSLEGGAS